MKYIIPIFFLILGCQVMHVPEQRLSQYDLDHRYEFSDNQLNVFLNNSLKCPVRIWVQSNDTLLSTFFDQINPITLRALMDTVLEYKVNNVKIRELNFASRLGDVNEMVRIEKIGLPFPKNRQYRLIQGYNSGPTHNTDWSRYALDFDLAVGDTICAATPGFVVGLIEDYKFGGEDPKWKNYANFLTIYNPSSGLYTQYVHLDYKGSLVRIGDEIEKGQVIAISGITGQTNVEHLHFNCLKPIHSDDGLVSISIDSIASYKVSALKRSDLIQH